MKPTVGLLENYFGTLARLSAGVVATDIEGTDTDLSEAVDWAVARIRETGAGGGKIMFVGNGGSAAIASHMAIDYSKNGGFPALAFNDGASLTCLANDLGYESVFAHHVRTLGKAGDLLVAISSSGKSASIVNAVSTARNLQIPTLTLSGFDAANTLRRMGDRNLYVPNGEYGFVEIMHLTLCHAILDLAMGWKPEKAR